jgi:hypothetical protein
MISIKSKFKTSVNIKLDLGSSWIQERYIPTPTHIDSLNGILEGFVSKGNKSHILVGSYGSGKSMIGTLIANLVSKEVDVKTVDQLIEKFDRINTEESAIRGLLEKVKKQEKRYIPIVINGKQGGFRDTVLATIYKSLKSLNVDLSLPSTVESIKSKIENWKERYPDTYDRFSYMLGDKKWDIKGFITEIEEFDNNTIDWFKKIYPSLTAGAEFSLNQSIDLNEELSYILKELDKKGYGLFLVYDEFGRFLQSIDKYETIEAMQDIQDIAELADHHESENFHVLLITHRNLKQYFLSYNEELQKEFQRIQGRFRIYHTQSDPATFIRIASQITEEYRKNYNIPYEFENQIVQYDLFPELNGREIKSIIVDNSYPLHPVTMFILPRLANAVAQNERTLFTFLESNEAGGLKKYYEINQSWYVADSLFDYFEGAIQEFLSDSLIGQAYTRYVKIKKRVTNSTTSKYELQLLKLLALWDIANLGNSQRLSKEFISFALSWDIQKVASIIEILERKKLIRYRLNDEIWEIFEGSIIDINKKIAEVKREGISKQVKINLLTDVLDSKFAYPKQYNDEKNMIRYATINPIYASDISLDFKAYDVDGSSDLVIFYVIPDTDIDESRKLITEVSKRDKRTIYSISTQEMTDLNEHLSTLSAISFLLDDKYFLSEDAIVEEELLKLKENTLFLIRENLKPFEEFYKSLWIYKGEELIIKSKISLSEHLTKIMRDVYSRTPKINNEAFNRRKISKQQLKAAKEVVNTLLGVSGSLEELKGPAKLIYASVVKNNDINEGNESQEVRWLRNDLMDILKDNKGSFTSILNLFSTEPYGIREPNIPILLIAILKNEWENVMFYHKDGSYINDLDGDIFYDRFLDKPENYSFSYQVIDNQYEEFITYLENIFSLFTSENDRASHPAVRVNRMLSKWFRNLPKISQKTNKLSKYALEFKQLIKEGEFEPDNSLSKLDLLFEDRSLIQTLKEEIELYSQQHKQQIEEHIYKLTKTNNYNDLCLLIQEKEEVIKVDNKVYKLILQSNQENWIDNLALELVGVKREDWSDATDEAFGKSITVLLEEDYKQDKSREYYEIIHENKTMAIPKVNLSSKGELIYSNIKTDLELMARRLPKDEIKVLLYKLLVDYYDENR